MNNKFLLILLSASFFLWGFLTSLNSILVPFLKDVFSLTYLDSMMIQVVFYVAPFLVCIPTAKFIKTFGYKKVMQISLLFLCIGCFLFYPASKASSFYFFLFSILILAMGIAVIQVVANPYVVTISGTNDATTNLTFCSFLNSAGTSTASYAGASIFLLALSTQTDISQLLSVTQKPYILLSILCILLIGLFQIFSKKEETKQVTQPTASKHSYFDVFKNKHFTLGSISMIIYIGVEVSIGTLLISYIKNGMHISMTSSTLGLLVSLYWGGSMLGRLLGSLVFKYIDSNTVLSINTLIAFILVFCAIIQPNSFGLTCLILVGLFNSVMYPVIFSSSINKLGDMTEIGSAILIMCGIGGAIIPMIQASIADHFNVIISFSVPMLGYLFIHMLMKKQKRYLVPATSH
ncbi:MAG: MFS transporter [Vibrio sp.]